MAIGNYSKGNQNMIFNHPSQKNINETIEQTQSNNQNPFVDQFKWLKREYMELKGILSALDGLKLIKNSQVEIREKKDQKTKEIERIDSGKSFKSMFSSKLKMELIKSTLQDEIQVM